MANIWPCSGIVLLIRSLHSFDALRTKWRSAKPGDAATLAADIINGRRHCGNSLASDTSGRRAGPKRGWNR